MNPQPAEGARAVADPVLVLVLCQRCGRPLGAVFAGVVVRCPRCGRWTTTCADGAGTRLGRPPVTGDPSIAGMWEDVRRQIEAGELSRRAAARALGVSDRTVRRLLERPERRGKRLLPHVTALARLNVPAP